MTKLRYNELTVRTGGYRAQYDHLNSHKYIGDYAMLASGKHDVVSDDDDDQDFCEPIGYNHLVRVKKVDDSVTDDEIKQAFYQEFSVSGCDHDYDCCGCRSFHAGPVEKVGETDWAITVHSSRNF